jgi:hypothetical protein
MADAETLERMSSSFSLWAAQAGDSPLYVHLASAVAEDPEMLDLAARLEHGPRPNVLFAAVQYLLGRSDPLAAWYPSIVTPARAVDDDPYPAFRGFVFARRDEILEIGRTRYTQTNEPRRCAVLLPVIAAAAERLGEPVHLVEIGASAGLNLCLENYRYEYASGVRLGRSSLVLTCEDRRGVPMPRRLPFVADRLGIDLHPVDIDDPREVAWLEALVWPEQEERRRRLAAAIAIRRMTRVTMIRADATEVLAAAMSRLSTTGPAVIWHSFAWNQMTPAQRDDLDAAVAEVARGRSVARLGLEFWERDMEWPEIRVGLTAATMRPVARAHYHGAWVEWTAAPGVG